MSELNGYSNGITNGHNGCNSEPIGQHWTVGLLNSQCRYLTAESFGFKVNANGVGLKKKQLWTLEPFGEDDSVCLRSHLDRYLSVDHFGNVTCESEEKTEGAKFFVAVANDGTGRWALRNSMRGYFLGAANDKLLCSAKVPGPAELWTVHLAARPQVNIRSVGRRRYARLSTDHEAIHVDANTPWGEDTLFTLEFHEGKYAIHTCNDKYLRFDGTLSQTREPESLFTLEFHSGYLALRDSVGSTWPPWAAERSSRPDLRPSPKTNSSSWRTRFPKQPSSLSTANMFLSSKTTEYLSWEPDKNSVPNREFTTNVNISHGYGWSGTKIVWCSTSHKFIFFLTRVVSSACFRFIKVSLMPLPLMDVALEHQLKRIRYLHNIVLKQKDGMEAYR
ncbi:protein singed [Caerostris darwini]|uniref:Protein singed n=1 Tax=Caerostris darwini TaxID=1538125 RepID=A0AAV4QVD7_9ARAC|nr:protein singed [Caerostris darwini]